MKIKVSWVVGILVLAILSVSSVFFIQHSSFSKEKIITEKEFKKENQKLKNQLAAKDSEIVTLKKTNKENNDKLQEIENSSTSESQSSEPVQTNTENAPSTAESSKTTTNETVAPESIEGSSSVVDSAKSAVIDNAGKKVQPETIVEGTETLDTSEQDNLTIETYFNTKKNEIIERKKSQVQAWKANGDVNWSDDLINSSLAEFSNSFPPVYMYQSETVDVAKSMIDKDFQFKYDSQFIK